MKTSTYQKALRGFIAAVLCISGRGSAQGPQLTQVILGPDQQAGVVITGGTEFALPEQAQVIKGLPYQATATTQVKQTLADGSHISQTTTATVARDSEGRTVRIQKLSKMGPWKSAADSSETDQPTLTTIFDPVANTHTDYTSDRKVAHIMTLPPAPPGFRPGVAVSRFETGQDGGPVTATAGGADMGPMTIAVQGHADGPQAQGAPSGNTASLGAKTIEDISATGTKTTTTIPAGTIGNDRDLVITRETWYSADLKLVLQSTQTDPRFGETAYMLSNIQRSEPDPSMFQVPAGYTVDKAPVHVQMRRAN